MDMSVRTRLVRLGVVLGFFVAWPAVSAASCNSNFLELKGTDGATFYTITSRYDALDAHKALADYKAIAAADDFMIVTEPDYSAESPMLGIAKPPSPNATVIIVDPKAVAVSVTTIVSPGHRADLADERAKLCGLVAKFEALRPEALYESAPDPAGQDLSRTTMPVATRSLRLLAPGIPFDVAAAKAALEPGHSTIRGQACAHSYTRTIHAAGSKVYLYPVTPYWEQLTALMKKAVPGKDKVLPDPLALATRMEATADSKGRFQFSRMKPGRYYLQTHVSAILGGSRDVYAGHVDGAFGPANVYRREDYAVGAGGDITKIVKIRNDGDSVKVTLQPPISPFRHDLAGSVFGCLQLP